MNTHDDNVDCCAQCNKPLSGCDEIHAVEGSLYCSKECAIDARMELIINSAKEQAAEWYNDYAETVTPADIGILKN